ncbi:hypothetical protein OO014_04530 [Intrasporangium calvum]|uniref:Carboxymuconolactone decarboxylase n=1 Tax=Intrasporangium calvum TaxID=53358 RepID=A0ABT5GE73_9MICO|nr:hypothetical protein [Intrasporangium calvum]MDC5696514.1 hypothetical protein [Intrasporangium calvum]
MGSNIHEAPATRPEFDVIGALSPRGRAALIRGWQNASQELDPDLIGQMARTVEAVLGQERLTRPTSSDDVEDAVLSLTEQFVDYVPDVDRHQLAFVEQRLGDRAVRHLVHAMYILDQNVRLRIALQRLDLGRPGGSGGTAAVEIPEAKPGVVRAAAEWHHSVYALRDGLDLRTNELLRLRAGDYHQCAFCLSLRRIAGGERVVDPMLEHLLLNYEQSDMPRQFKTALRLADIYMSDPVRLGSDLRDVLLGDYSREEIVEILMVVSACNHQKIRVALGTAMPARPQGLSEYVVHDDGSIEVGALISG